MAERKVPHGISHTYAFSGTQAQAYAEAQRVAQRDFDPYPYIRVDLYGSGSTTDGASAEWSIVIGNGEDGYLKVPTVWPPRPDPYQSDGNEYDGV